MLRRFQSFCALFALAAFAAVAFDACAKPDKSAPPAKEKAKAKDQAIPKVITGETNWGKLTIKGRKLIFEGHPIWNGDGEIRPDGKVSILWVHISDGRLGPGFYSINAKGELEGAWGWNENVNIEPDGSLIGELMDDTVRHVTDED